jgi:two-component system nitrogen regulation response regulator GlnG
MSIPVAWGEKLPRESHAIPWKRAAAAESAVMILVASEDESVRQTLCELLSGYHIDTLAVASIDGVKSLLAVKRIAVVLSGVSLEGGSYRDLLSEVKERAPGVPVIVVSTPASSDEYRDYLASVNSGAFDFVCHPYQKAELERILRLALLCYARNTAQSSAATAS